MAAMIVLLFVSLKESPKLRLPDSSEACSPVGFLTAAHKGTRRQEVRTDQWSEARLISTPSVTSPDLPSSKKDILKKD